MKQLKESYNPKKQANKDVEKGNDNTDGDAIINEEQKFRKYSKEGMINFKFVLICIIKTCPLTNIF